MHVLPIYIIKILKITAVMKLSKSSNKLSIKIDNFSRYCKRCILMLYNDNKKTFVKIMHDELYKELYENSWIQMLEQMEH